MHVCTYIVNSLRSAACKKAESAVICGERSHVMFGYKNHSKLHVGSVSLSGLVLQTQSRMVFGGGGIPQCVR